MTTTRLIWSSAAPVARRSAFNARKYNPVIGEFYRHPVSRGKPYKQAMTACVRKLLVLMNTLVARGQLWDPFNAT
jgi:transposase